METVHAPFGTGSGVGDRPADRNEIVSALVGPNIPAQSRRISLVGQSWTSYLELKAAPTLNPAGGGLGQLAIERYFPATAAKSLASAQLIKAN